MRAPQHTDVAVVGGGPSGALLALRLAESGRQVVLLEARQADQPIHDARALALSWASRQQLQAVGAWPDSLPCSLIDSVHVSQQGCWGRTVLAASDTRLPHLGAVVDYPLLTQALDARLEAAGVTVLWGCRVTAVRSMARYAELQYHDALAKTRQLTCRLAVLAEGGALIDALPGVERLEVDYHQTALLVQLNCERIAAGVAYERFSHTGPLALLPHADGYMLVWTRAHAEAERFCQANTEQQIAEVQQALGERQGRVLSLGSPASFPLRMRRASQRVSGRVVLIGNAAQTLHPVAAQGLNLGLRDAAGLAQILEHAPDPGESSLLAAYTAARRMDAGAVIGFTHGLMRMTESHGVVLSRLRGVGMNLLDSLPLLRRQFAGHLVFGVGVEQ